jgi:hypothetical protein
MMLRRHGSEPDVAEGELVPPVQLRYRGGAEPAKERSDAQRSEPARPRMASRNLSDRPAIEVIVVIV